MAFQPMPLSRKPAPFDHPEWVFELKYDGFRSLAVIQNGRCELISRNGHPFNSFDTLRKHDFAVCGQDGARRRNCLSRQEGQDRSSTTCFFIVASRASSHSIC